MAKLIRYRIIAAVQFFLVFFFMMLVSDYTQYDAEMFNLKINTIYEREYDYLDCRVSDYLIIYDWLSPSRKTASYFSFYNNYEFALERKENIEINVGYVTPTFCMKLPDEITWIEGSKPISGSEIAIGEDLYKIMQKYSSQPLTVGSRVTLKAVSLIKDDVFLPIEATIKGIYSTSSTVFFPDFKYRHLIGQTEQVAANFFYKNYNPFNESFYMRPFNTTTPDFATPTNILVEVPNDKNELVNMYKENRHVRYCIDSYEVDSRDNSTNNALINHKEYLVINMIVFGIIGAFALFLLFLFLFASTQLVIIRSEGKSLKDIFKKELLFYALILFGGGVVFTIYTLIFPWAFIIQPILISLLCFIGIITINWLLIFIWKYKELSRNL